MKLDVLLSAMFLESYDYIDSLNITGDCVVINQTNEDAEKKIIHDNDRRIIYICTQERGLSRSRNMAIENAENEVCILCDNDIEYVADYENIIISAFERHPEADIICFHLNRPNQPTPIYDVEKKMSWRDIGKIGSPQIAFRKKQIGDIKFNTLLGAGAKFSMGEESAFLVEVLRKHKIIYYVPQKIANLREEESTWFRGFTDKYFKDRGACICVTSNNRKFVMLTKIVGFAFKIKIKKDRTISVINAVKNMYSGVNEYLKELGRNDNAVL